MDAGIEASVQRNDFFVGVDHLFGVITQNPALLPQSFVERHFSALLQVRRELAKQAWQGGVQTVGGEVFYTPRCAQVLATTNKLAERYRRGAATVGHLLLAMLADARSAPSRIMDGLGLNRGEIIEALRTELMKMPARTGVAPQTPQAAATAERPQVEAEPAAGPLESMTRDLTDAARKGELGPAIGRDQEMFEILQVLARKGKNNVILVGEAGVGKTQIVEGLALAALEGGMGGLLAGDRILELNIAALLSGTQYRGAFEEKLLALLEQLKQSKDIILFIDEIHLIMGAGATEGGSMDVANLLKPALARGEIRCIGATTEREYRKFIEKDPAIERRFQMVRIEGLTEEATLKVLEHLRPSLERHHHVHIGAKAIQAAVSLTERYMANRQLPDKAIDVLDQACARYRLKLIAVRDNPHALVGTMMPGDVNKVTPHDIRKVISQITAIPIEEMTAGERLLLDDLERRLKSKLIGQDEAVAKVVSVVKQSRAGLADPNRPQAVMLFLGPSGVGKTQLAKLLADSLFGSANHLITFDMSEYAEEQSVSKLTGAAPGLVRSEEEGRLTAAMRSAPFSILLFDEIEKAHPRIFDIFLPIFDEGRLKDSQNRDVSFRNCLIILTSNIGAECLSRSEAHETRAALMDELRQHFRPEFINRIDDIIPFHELLFEDVRIILKSILKELADRLAEKQVYLRVYQGAYEHLAKEGYDPEYGARELKRTVNRLVVAPISDMLLRDQFQAGDTVEVLMDDEGKLAFCKGAPQ